MHRLQTDDFTEGQGRLRATLIKQAETVDRLLANGNQPAAAKLLTAMRNQLQTAVLRHAIWGIQGVIDATLESLES